MTGRPSGPNGSGPDLAAGLAALLQRPEPGGYGAPVAEIPAAGRDLYVVSDLHLAAGLLANGTYHGTENFFADQAFWRFLRAADADLEAQGRAGAGLLVINGDFVDFMRVSECPDGPAAFQAWSDLLAPLGLHYTPKQLEDSISEKEREFGLRTDHYKSVWKLAAVATGHPALFDALAWWVGQGHHLAVTKGNHDVEWYWRPVRDFLRLALADRLADQRGGEVAEALEEILHRIWFGDHALLVNGQVHIEHGHQYEPTTCVIGPPELEGKWQGQLNLPFGSFFNRYLINHVELGYPYIDNVRPQTNILPVLIRERFPTAVRLIFAHLPFALRVIPRRYYRYLLRIWLPALLAILVPVAIVVYLITQDVIAISGAALGTGGGEGGGLLGAVRDRIGGMMGNLAWLVASYVLSQVLAFFQVHGPASLEIPMRGILEQHPGHLAAVVGHTHNPDQSILGGQGYFNTGTWIAVIETTAASVREDRTYTFAHFPAEGDRLGQGLLLRWDDEAGRAEPAVVVRRSAA